MKADTLKLSTTLGAGTRASNDTQIIERQTESEIAKRANAYLNFPESAN